MASEAGAKATKSDILMQSLRSRHNDVKNLTSDDWAAAFEWIDSTNQAHGCMKAVAAWAACSDRTVRSRYEARDTKASKRGPEPLLGTAAENAIAAWIITQHESCVSVPVPVLLHKVKEYAAYKGIAGTVAGRKWLRSFLARHKELEKKGNKLTAVESRKLARTNKTGTIERRIGCFEGGNFASMPPILP